jgi:hypothetical protein
MMRGMDTKQFIDSLGGIGFIADHLNVTTSAVANWRLAGRAIPWKHRPALARLAAEKAVNLPPLYWEAGAVA